MKVSPKNVEQPKIVKQVTPKHTSPRYVGIKSAKVDKREESPAKPKAKPVKVAILPLTINNSPKAPAVSQRVNLKKKSSVAKIEPQTQREASKESLR